MSVVAVPKSVPHALLRVLLLLSLVLGSMAAMAAPRVATSIRPLQLIAAAVMDGVGQPELVLGAGQDPHEISLRPSERRLLAEADLVLWIGPALEFPLQSILALRPEALLTAQTLPGIELLPAGDSVDPHLWLSLANAQVIAAALAERLVALDPVQAARYRENLQRFDTVLAATREDTHAVLAAANPLAWGVYHHALVYLEHEQGLPAALTITDSHGNMPGVRALRGTRQMLAERNLGCLLAEPGVDLAKVRSLLDRPRLDILTVDILGTDQALAPGGYPAMYETLVAALVACAKDRDND